MKSILAVALPTLLTLTSPAFCVVANQVDEFQDGTTQGWVSGPLNPNPPINVGTGGTAGAGDKFLQVTGNGGVGAGSNLVTFNNVQWTGDFTAARIEQIALDLQNLSSVSLTMRLGFNGPGGEFVTTGVPLAAGSGWTHITFDVTPAGLINVGGIDAGTTLAAVSEMRLIDNPLASYIGATVAGSFGADNITALPPLIRHSTWTGLSGGSWGTPAAGFGVNWGAGQGSPGVDTLSPGVDSAIFGSTAGSVTVNLDGAAPNLNAIAFNNTGSYTIAQGSGSTALTLGGTSPTITVAGTHAINTPLTLASGLMVSLTNSGDSLTISGAVGDGGSNSSLTLGGAGTLTLANSSGNTYGGGTIINAGTLLASNSGGSATGTGDVMLNGGTLGGAGIIAGTVACGAGAHKIHPSEGLPAGSTSTLQLGGLTTSSTTTLDFNLVTPNTAGGSDLIAVSGALNISGGGTLAFTNHGLGQPSLGYYKIMSYGSLTGTASNLTMPAIANNISYGLDLNKDPGFVDVHRGFQGDANDDGTVNIVDLGTLATHYNGTGATWSQGDFNGDGVVNIVDLGILATFYNQSVGSFDVASASSSPASGVPEPTSLLLLGAGLVGVLGIHRRVRKGLTDFSESTRR